MKRIKRLDEFVAAEPATKPTTAPPQTAPPVTRPNRGIPSKRPGDQFFAQLEEIKDTPQGKSMIKKLHNKYATGK
jgi:hypothetical protein